jgi:hypothetical protein
MDWNMKLPPMQKHQEKELRIHLRKAQNEYRIATEAVARALEEVNYLPPVEVHLAIRLALRRESRAVKRVAHLLSGFSDFVLEEAEKATARYAKEFGEGEDQKTVTHQEVDRATRESAR